MQRLLRMGDWDADAVGDVLRGYVLERLCTDGVLTVHENGCIKQGIPSVGGPGGTPEPAARSTTARSALSAYVTGVSGVLIDRELPPTRTWTEDRGRAAGIDHQCRIRRKVRPGRADAAVGDRRRRRSAAPPLCGRPPR